MYMGIDTDGDRCTDEMCSLLSVGCMVYSEQCSCPHQLSPNNHLSDVAKMIECMELPGVCAYETTTDPELIMDIIAAPLVTSGQSELSPIPLETDQTPFGGGGGVRSVLCAPQLPGLFHFVGLSWSV